MSYKALHIPPRQFIPITPITSAHKPKYSAECDRYASIIGRYSWDIRIAMAVMQAESGCDPSSANLNDVHQDAKGNIICKGSFGLMQISCHSGEVYDPERNIAIAWEKYKSRGWQPWGAYTDNRYKQFLK